MAEETDGLATGEGFDLTFDEEIADILRYARYAHTKAKPISPKWVRVRGFIVEAARKENGEVYLVLNRPWPEPGAIVLWLAPNVARRIANPPDFVVGLSVEALGLAYSRDQGKTLELQIADTDQLAFISDGLESPELEILSPEGKDLDEAETEEED